MAFAFDTSAAKLLKYQLDNFTKDAEIKSLRAELEAAHAAMPSDSTRALIYAAVNGNTLPKRGVEQVRSWLMRLDATHPGKVQP